MSLKTLKIISILITIVGMAVLWQGSTFRQYGDQSGYEPLQPINFSHKVHAGDNKINCLYCHSTADKTNVAGIPTATTCMNCHTKVLPDSPEVQKIVKALDDKRPIEWVKVNDLPDHVMFNHSRHVVAGIDCAKCHGPVDTMERIAQFDTFSMGSCVNCHRQYQNVTLDKDGNPTPTTLNDKNRLKAPTDCSVCHH